MASRGDAGRRVPVEDPRIRGLLAYWLELRGARGVPDRRDFDPVRVVPVLSYFWILKREAGDGRWRFALAGEDTIRLLGRKLVGACIDDVFPDRAGRFNAAIDAVASLPGVLHMAGAMYRTDGAPVVAERLSLPMRDGEVVDRIYGATVYRWPTPVPIGRAHYQGNVEPTIIPVARLARGL